MVLSVGIWYCSVDGIGNIFGGFLLDPFAFLFFLFFLFTFI